MTNCGLMLLASVSRGYSKRISGLISLGRLRMNTFESWAGTEVQIQQDKIPKKLRRTLTWRQLSALARLALMLAMSAVLVQGRTYYVSFTQGADTNAGTVSATWKPIARVNAQRLQPGVVVAFKRGETWHETLRPRSSG